MSEVHHKEQLQPGDEGYVEPPTDAPPAPAPPPQAVVKLDTQGLNLESANFGVVIRPENMGDVVTFATLMAKSDFAVPPKFRGNPGACMAVLMKALRWEMDPYGVIEKAYVTENSRDEQCIAYESQLVSAVINTRGPFEQRPNLKFFGAGDDMQCEVKARIKGERLYRVMNTPPLKDVKKNSPLWKSDPEQQLAYYALRAFGRRVCPEVLLGVYTPDEIETAEPLKQIDADVVTPPRPARSAFERAQPNDEGDESLLDASGFRSSLQSCTTLHAVEEVRNNAVRDFDDNTFLVTRVHLLCQERAKEIADGRTPPDEPEEG